MTEKHESVRDWLDSWRLAAATAVALAIILGLWSIKLTADTRHLAEQNRELVDAVHRQSDEVQKVQKARVAADRASRQDQVDSCFARNATMPGVIALLDALGKVVTDPEDMERIRNYTDLTRDQTPTRADCVQLARRLHIAVPRAEG